MRLALALAATLLLLPAAALGQDAPSTFQTPSGNILCQVLEAEDATQTQLNCDVLEFSNTPPAAPADCPWPEDFGHSFALPGIPVIGYGQAWEYGDYFRCTVERAGLTCQNQFGNGFFLSRDNQEIY